jgi:phage baseplate assembly protein V
VSENALTAAIERIYRRVMNTIACSRISLVDDGGAVQRAQILTGAAEIKDATPRLAEFGFASSPPRGSDAVVVFIGGDRSNGCIIATGHQASRLRGLAAGDAAIYDVRGITIRLTAAGIVIDGAGLPVTVNNVPQVIVNGGDVIADGISLKTHVHQDTQPGAGLSGPPS